ncbi:MAG: hypothetical protein AAGI34_01500 [Pseudomonadota bacterium]
MTNVFRFEAAHRFAETRVPGVIVAAVALAAAMVLAGRFVPNPLTVAFDDLTMHIDDAMRLVQARDFYEGQGWFDLRQYRLGAEDAAPMHWSRVVDAPIAFLTALLVPLVGQEQALLGAAVLWPASCATLYLLMAAAMGARLCGLRGMLCLGLIVASSVYFFIRPGRVDHHYVQTLLMLGMAFLLILAEEKPWRAALAGATACVSMAVGMSELPLILAASGLIALVWVLGGTGARLRAIAFFTALAVCAPLALVATAPPAQRLVGWCDAFSVVYVLGVVLGAGGSALAALVLPETAARALKLAALALAGAVAAGVVVLAYPQCLDGPYTHLDPETRAWVGNRQEVRGLREILANLEEVSAFVLSVLSVWPLTGIAGLALAFWSAPPERRFAWALLGVLALTGWIISLNQLRGVNTSLSFAAFGAMFLMVWATSWTGLANALKPVAMTAIWLTQVPHTAALYSVLQKRHAIAEAPRAPSVAEVNSSLNECTAPAALAPLAAMPPGRVATSVEFGSFVLLHTPHWVLASPHHRNYAGNLAAIRLTDAAPEALQRALSEWRIDYVAVCTAPPLRVLGNPGSAWLPEAPPEALPAWLEPLPSVEPMRLFRFVPD